VPSEQSFRGKAENDTYRWITFKQCPTKLHCFEDSVRWHANPVVIGDEMEENEEI
jgi:hypothetical protein